MLRTPAPFPLVGSYALHVIDGQTHLVRIQYRKSASPDHGEAGVALAMVSFPNWKDASASKTVPLGELVDATPLTLDERADMRAIEREFGPKLHTSQSAKAKRYHGLRARDARTETLQRLMERAGLRQTFEQMKQADAA